MERNIFGKLNISVTSKIGDHGVELLSSTPRIGHKFYEVYIIWFTPKIYNTNYKNNVSQDYFEQWVASEDYEQFDILCEETADDFNADIYSDSNFDVYHEFFGIVESRSNEEAKALALLKSKFVSTDFLFDLVGQTGDVMFDVRADEVDDFSYLWTYHESYLKLVYDSSN